MRELSSRVDKANADIAGLHQRIDDLHNQVEEKHALTLRLGAKQAELQHEEQVVLQLIQDAAPTAPPLGWPSGSSWPPRPPLVPSVPPRP
eukprot:8412902-Prorocentrum_lima.AAC.1